jgi:folylpolyglutamate synthase/dihydropteroate synthase
MNVAIINQFDTIEEAYQSALNHANIEDRIVVFGSFYSVSPILRLMKE